MIFNNTIDDNNNYELIALIDSISINDNSYLVNLILI